MTVREMQIDDLEQVVPLERESFSMPWTENGFFTFLIRDDALFLVAEERGQILGYCGALISFDESEITNVCVSGGARRRGIGRMLMEELMARLEKRGVTVVHLEVRRSNAAAIALYEGLGFLADGLRRDYYEEPREDAILMSRRSEGVPAGGL